MLERRRLDLGLDPLLYRSEGLDVGYIPWTTQGNSTLLEPTSHPEHGLAAHGPI